MQPHDPEKTSSSSKQHALRGLTRREFMQKSALGVSGLIIGFYLPHRFALPAKKSASAHSVLTTPHADPSRSRNDGLELNAWIRITPESRVIFALDRAEMGQGVMTSHATMVAEELNLSLDFIDVIFAEPTRKEYKNPAFKVVQATGGSTSVATSWKPLREATALARQLLIRSAAKSMQVSEIDCVMLDAKIRHLPSGRELSLGAAAVAVAKLKNSEKNSLKAEIKKNNFKHFGSNRQRLDALAKVTGQAVFGLDVQLPDLQIATVVHAPIRGQKIQVIARSAVPDEVQVIPILNQGAVALVSDSYWKVSEAAKNLVVKWDFHSQPPLSTKKISLDLHQGLKEGRANVLNREGTSLTDLRAAARMRDALADIAEHEQAQAVYEVPFAPHVTMETMNCTASLQNGLLEVWLPTQMPDGALQVAADTAKMSRDQVRVHSTYIGGGFGRRIVQDTVAEAVELACLLKRPVKVIWSREEDYANDFYRPAYVGELKGAVNAAGDILAWHHRLVGDSVMRYASVDFLKVAMPDCIGEGTATFLGRTATGLLGKNFWLLTDPTSAEGAVKIPYKVDKQLMEYVAVNTGVPLGFWRSVGHSYTAFMVETFMDELAALAGKDPVDFRLHNLRRHHTLDDQDKDDRFVLRHLGVLQALVKFSAYGQTTLPQGWHRGIAVHPAFESYCGLVIDLSIEDREICIKRVYAVIDCGQALNPDLVKSQVESGIVYGLTAALKQEINIVKGQVQEKNFHNADLLRMYECPEIFIEVMNTAYEPTGVGEVAVPPVAPAIANALFSATGKRYRRLPIKLS